MRSSKRLDRIAAVPVRADRAEGPREEGGGRRRDLARHRRSRHADAGRRRRGAAGRGGRSRHAPVPVEPRPRTSSARRVAKFYERRFGVTLDPETEIVPALGAKECIFNLNLAFLDPGDVALASRSRLPGLHRRAADRRRRAGDDAAAAGARLRAGPVRDQRRRPRARADHVPELPEQPDGRDRAGRAVRARRSSSAARTTC